MIFLRTFLGLVLAICSFAMFTNAPNGYGQSDIFTEIPLLPNLNQSLPQIGVDRVHDLGITGEGVNIVVIDNFRPDRDDPCGRFAHGDWVKGVLEAVAPDARVRRINVPLDVPGTPDRPCFAFSGQELLEALNEALENVDDWEIDIINYSIGGGRFERECVESDPFSQVIRELVARGVKFVTAAGNNGFTNALGFPECMPETISVGAVYDYNSNELEQANVCADFPIIDKITCYSNRAYFLDFLAPGSVIAVNESLVSIGTSASAPHVAGVIALLLEIDDRLTLEEVREILSETGKPITDSLSGRTFPRVDALEAVLSLLELENENPSVGLRMSPGNPTTEDTITFTAQASDPDNDVISFTWIVNGFLQGSHDPILTWENPPAGQHTVELQATDGRGGFAQTSVTFTVTEPTLEADDLTKVARALDSNVDGIHGDAEVLMSIRFWVTQDEVPGADVLVSDDLILELIVLWITATPI